LDFPPREKGVGQGLPKLIWEQQPETARTYQGTRQSGNGRTLGLRPMERARLREKRKKEDEDGTTRRIGIVLLSQSNINFLLEGIGVGAWLDAG
jgi:hypothetical protein